MVNSANQRQRAADDNVLVPDLSGGLNVTSSPLNTPSGDSPYMRNTRIRESGNVATRPGTQHLTELSASSSVGFCGLSYTTKAGYQLAIIKDTVDIVIYEVVTAGTDEIASFTNVMTKANVWPAIAADIRFDHVVTNETNSRIIFTTGIAVPVQLQLVESSVVASSGSAITDVVFVNQFLEHAATTSIVVWVNGVRVTASAVSFNGSTDELTVTLTTPLAAGTYFVDLVYASWQWWAEAALYEGRDLYQPQTRFATDINDISVAIPTDLTRTFDAVFPGAFNILPYQSTDKTDDYDYKADRTPTLSTQFNFSQGITYDGSAGNEIVPGISHVTFGALINPAATTEVNFIKAEELLFNGGTGITGQNMLVLVDDGVSTQHTNPATPSGNDFGDAYYLRNKTVNVQDFYSTLSVVTGTTTVAQYITFDATEFVGLTFNALVKLINREVSSFAGTNATNLHSTINNHRDGNLVPAYGLYEWADYLNGSFPRTCELFQGRLVFGGFPNKPLQVVFSNTFDSAEPDVFFNDFSVRTQDLESTDAISVFVSSVENDAAITAIIDFAGSLFVYTLNKTIRLFGGDAGITPQSINSSVVASVGALNAASVELVDNSVIYLSNNGLYQLKPSLQVGDFDVTPASVNVTSLLKNVNNRNVSWLSYNPNDNELFIAVTDSDTSRTANRLYHLSLFRAAWSEYTLFYGRFNTSFGFSVLASQVFTFMSLPRDPNSVDNRFDVISYPYFYPIDVAKESTAQLATIDFDLVAAQSVTYEKNLEVIPLDYELTPVNALKDVEVTVDGTAIGFATDYHKRSNNTRQQFLHISKQLQIGSSILHYPVAENGKYPVAIYKDNIEQTDFTVAVSTSAVQATLNFTNAAGTVKRYGYTFPAVYVTPLLVRQTISRPKSLRNLYVLLANVEYLDVYLQSDLNTEASQAIIDLVGLWKRKVGLNIGIRQDNSSSVANTNQLSNDLLFDVGRYDIDAPASQSASEAKVAYHLTGLANHIQVVFYTYSLNVWELIAYELELKFAQRTSRNSFD